MNFWTIWQIFRVYFAGVKREALLTNTFGFVDGLNLPVHESSDLETQNAYYSS
ncbi:hypothetical protein BC833DRAFT_626179 [Globomyces pollinis-pini]|nr:hypothetical protein BC833DRAFT_626179 [Globomyces pollinis-pini]